MSAAEMGLGELYPRRPGSFGVAAARAAGPTRGPDGRTGAWDRDCGRLAACGSMSDASEVSLSCFFISEIVCVFAPSLGKTLCRD